MLKAVVAIVLVLGLAATPAAFAAGPAPSHTTTALGAPERYTVAADGHPMRVWARRAARPRGSILFVHGRTWSARPNFDLQTPDGSLSVLKAFADKGFAAYAVDLRGYGETPRDASGWLSPTRAAADVQAVLAWIEKRDGRRPVLVGYSRGSMVAFLTAQTYPDSLSMLVLYGYPADPDVKLPAETGAPVVRRAPTTLQAAASDFITPGAASPETVRAYAEQAVKADPIRVDWGHEDEFNALDPALIKVPTLLLQGVGDPNAKPQAHARVFNRLGTPSRSWVVLPGADHVAHVERGHAAWVAAIIAFFDRSLPADR
jgi:pimeloyl-ACP methyl ester carboxylesterase